MNYEMEELVPIVSRLAEKYTSFESTSMTYEKAELLMAAVLYCIREVELSEGDSGILAGTISAQQAYEIGVGYVEKKTKMALDLYNEILPGFLYYENHCLHDTFIKGLPEFFRWYDIKFEPQNTILTLDYPVLKDLSGYTGIDRVYEYITCICVEQRFLEKFPEGYIINIISEYDNSYRDMIDNICEIVFNAVIAHILINKPLSEQSWKEADYIRIQEVFSENNLQDINNQLKNAVENFIREYYGDDGKLFAYLADSINGILVRLKAAADNGTLFQMFG